MKLLVSDAGPIISAARARQLDLLRSVVQRLVLPRAVHEEIVIGGAGKPGSETEALACWTEVRSASDTNPVEQALHVEAQYLPLVIVGDPRKEDRSDAVSHAVERNI